MKAGFLSLALIIVVIAFAPGDLASATRIASAQSQPRNQTQSQDGLPTEKKRTLSQFGPEIIEGLSDERGTSSDRSTVRQPRSPRPTSAFPSAPPSRPPAPSTRESFATPSETPLQPSMETPSPTVPATALDSGGIQQLPLGQEDASASVISRWTPHVFVLLALALIVSLLLIFTITKLWEKIRESSSG